MEPAPVYPVSRRGVSSLALTALLLAGCSGSPVTDDIVAVSFPLVGEAASYRIEFQLGGQAALEVAYRWTGSGLGRDGYAHERSVIQAEYWTTAELEPPPGGRPGLIDVDAETGFLLATGAWDGISPPRSQGFQARSPIWAGFPGLHEDEESGSDRIRAILLPLFVINTRLMMEPDVSTFDHLDVPFTVKTRADGDVVVEHPDAGDPEGTDQGLLRYRFDYDGSGFFPAAITGHSDHNGSESAWFSMERMDWKPGAGTALALPAATGGLQGPPAESDFGEWSLLPPEGEHDLPFSLHEAESRARGDPLYGAYRELHPQAYLVSANYRFHPELEVLLPGVPALPAPHAIWRLKFADTSGEGHYLEVRRVLAETIPTSTDYVHASLSESFEYIPQRSQLPQTIFPLAGALAVAPDEIGRELGTYQFVDYQVSLDPRIIHSEHSITWDVGEREPQKLFPQTQITIAGESAKTLLRAHLYE